MVKRLRMGTTYLEMTGFNPSVGILGGQTLYRLLIFSFSFSCFNPSVGILGGQTFSLLSLLSVVK